MLSGHSVIIIYPEGIVGNFISNLNHQQYLTTVCISYHKRERQEAHKTFNKN